LMSEGTRVGALRQEKTWLLLWAGFEPASTT
jgi:hypothetical protein